MQNTNEADNLSKLMSDLLKSSRAIAGINTTTTFVNAYAYMLESGVDMEQLPIDVRLFMEVCASLYKDAVDAGFTPGGVTNTEAKAA